MVSGTTRIHPRKVPEPLGLQAIRSKDQWNQDPTGPNDFRVFPRSAPKVWGRAGVEPVRAECAGPQSAHPEKRDEAQTFAWTKSNSGTRSPARSLMLLTVKSPGRRPQSTSASNHGPYQLGTARSKDTYFSAKYRPALPHVADRSRPWSPSNTPRSSLSSHARNRRDLPRSGWGLLHPP